MFKELAIAIGLEARYQKDVVQSWGWERFPRYEWAEDMLPYPRLIGQQCHAAIARYFAGQ